MKRLSIVLFASAMLVTTACGKKDGGGASGGGGDKPAAVKLPNVALQIDVAGETMVSKGMAATSDLVNGESVGAIEIELTTKPETLDEAKADAKDFSPKNMKDEKLADGWALTYENKGSAGANFFVRVRREIGGKAYVCTTTGSQAEQAKAVLAACKSLRP